jgi:hypothetical protein
VLFLGRFECIVVSTSFQTPINTSVTSLHLRGLTSLYNRYPFCRLLLSIQLGTYADLLPHGDLAVIIDCFHVQSLTTVTTNNTLNLNVMDLGPPAPTLRWVLHVNSNRVRTIKVLSNVNLEH